MATFAVIYQYTDDADGRDRFRAKHREFLNTSGWTLLSGPLSDPAGALIIAEAEAVDALAIALDEDPFQREGLIVERFIQPFDPVGGSLASAFAPHRS